MRKTILLIILLAGLIAVAAPVEASLTFNYDTEYSGGSAPASQTTPWLSAEFSNAKKENIVMLTLTAEHLTSSEFVSQWYFNLDPLFGDLIPSTSKPGSIKIEYVGGTEYPSTKIDKNEFKAGNNGYFDIRISFSTDSKKHFGEGDTATFKITFDPGSSDLTLDADSFSFVSEGKGKTGGGLYTAAHVQGIDGKYSGWVSGDPTSSLVPAMVPIPGAVWLLGSGLLGLLGFRRRQKK